MEKNNKIELSIKIDNMLGEANLTPLEIFGMLESIKLRFWATTFFGKDGKT